MFPEKFLYFMLGIAKAIALIFIQKLSEEVNINPVDYEVKLQFSCFTVIQRMMWNNNCQAPNVYNFLDNQQISHIYEFFIVLRNSSSGIRRTLVHLLMLDNSQQVLVILFFLNPPLKNIHVHTLTVNVLSHGRSQKWHGEKLKFSYFQRTV